MELELPRLISDGMVLQQKKKVHIWGFDKPGRRVMVCFLGKEYIGITDSSGAWEIRINELLPGGPYTMYFSDDAGNEAVVADILIGDVWICSGQSNMELPMERVKEQYPEELNSCRNPFIRTFKITEHADYHGPLKELLSGEWRAAGQDTILQFSAAAYFFAKQIHQMTGVPVGLINASLGGSRIESWMGEKMLTGYDEMLKTVKQYADDRFVKDRRLLNEQQANQWHQRLDSLDIGLKEHWEQDKSNVFDWKTVVIPFFFRETSLCGFIGSVWFRRTFTISKGMALKEARLLLGTIVDSDTVYVNGILTGHTDYQYPPRRYDVQSGVLREGENTIVIRVKCENGHGRFTPDKQYLLFTDEEKVDLQGRWHYKIGACCERMEPADFVNWKPTGLFNGMLAPCCQYDIAGFLWYQGESNTHVPWNYLDLLKRLIEGWRRLWNNEKLPFLYVQLPNFSVDVYDSDGDETGQGFPALRELQRRALSVPGTGMAVTIDLGEDNDLHPLNKKDVGFRLAMLAAKILYGLESECSGPQTERIVTIAGEQGQGYITDLYCNHADDGMYAFAKGKGHELLDFELLDENGSWFPAGAELFKDKVRLTCDKMRGKPAGVRYCYSNTNKGALVYNRAGFPMSPFTETEGDKNSNENHME